MDKKISKKNLRLFKLLASEDIGRKRIIDRDFPVIISKDDDWFIASCPSLDLVAQGRTRKEAKENIRDLIKDYLEEIKEK